MLTSTGRVIAHIVIIVVRFLLGRSGRRGTADNADPSTASVVRQ